VTNKINACPTLDLEEQYQYEQSIIKQMQKETQQCDPVFERFKYISFFSRSKGRGRKRKVWEDVELISISAGHFQSFNKFPFDVYATEIFPNHENPTELLRERIRKL
jgi:hypothetical protein